MEIVKNDFLIYLLAGITVVCIWLIARRLSHKKQLDQLANENAKLIAENAILEAEHLKFQLQPHALRNMVATLHVAAKNLYKGSEAFADTLDYILYKGSKHLVSVADELSFLESYKSLQGNFVYQTAAIKIDNTSINTSSKYYHTPCLPHLITAYFIENAFKHGDVNHPEFLTVRLKLTATTFEMLVINRISPKINNKKGGIGLSNMRKRLDLLHSGKYEIINSCNEHEYHSRLTVHF